jgi:hypothetical protein
VLGTNAIIVWAVPAVASFYVISAWVLTVAVLGFLFSWRGHGSGERPSYAIPAVAGGFHLFFLAAGFIWGIYRAEPILLVVGLIACALSLVLVSCNIFTGKRR